MTDYSHVVFALSAFALIKRMDCRVFEGCNCRSEPDCPAQVGRTTLGHLHSGAGEVAGLLYSRIVTKKFPYPQLRIASKTYVKINSFHFVGNPHPVLRVSAKTA